MTDTITLNGLVKPGRAAASRPSLAPRILAGVRAIGQLFARAPLAVGRAFEMAYLPPDGGDKRDRY